MFNAIRCGAITSCKNFKPKYMDKTNTNRRTFLRNSSLLAGGLALPAQQMQAEPLAERLPREVWVGTIAVSGMTAETSADMTAKVLGIMEHLLPYRPDIICLPECFAFTSIQQKYRIAEVAEEVPGPIISPFMNFARQHRCYIICPTYIRQDAQLYIAATLIDRQGKIVGTYRKMRPADSEMAEGVKPGPMDPPVFTTDFGKIGIQICFDLKWEEGWQQLKAGGAEIIFWPSAYAGGREICSRAWRHQVYLVSSTQKDSSRICDMTGDVIAQTNRWQPHWACAPINLEKTFLHVWPAVSVFPAIQQKYGRKVQLTTYAEEEWATLESFDPGIKVKDILAEFNLPTHDELLHNSALMHDQKR